MIDLNSIKIIRLLMSKITKIINMVEEIIEII